MIRTLRPSIIAVGALGDKAISDSKRVFKRQTSIKRDENEPYDNFIKNCQKKRIIPSPMGVVSKTKEVKEVIKLNEYKIGDDYAEVFANSLKKVAENKILHLNMKNNKLTDTGGKAIIDNLTEYILTIDISWNPKMSNLAYE